jgi:hypothetical protein
MTRQPQDLFLKSFHEQFIRHFPVWANDIRQVDEALLNIEIVAPNSAESNPLWIEVEKSGALLVAFGAAHAHFEQWTDDNNPIEAAIDFVQRIIREEIITIYLQHGSGALADRASAHEQP